MVHYHHQVLTSKYTQRKKERDVGGKETEKVNELVSHLEHKNPNTKKREKRMKLMKKKKKKTKNRTRSLILYTILFFLLTKEKKNENEVKKETTNEVI